MMKKRVFVFCFILFCFVSCAVRRNPSIPSSFPRDPRAAGVDISPLFVGDNFYEVFSKVFQESGWEKDSTCEPFFVQKKWPQAKANRYCAHLRETANSGEAPCKLEDLQEPTWLPRQKLEDKDELKYFLQLMVMEFKDKGNTFK